MGAVEGVPGAGAGAGSPPVFHLQVPHHPGATPLSPPPPPSPPATTRCACVRPCARFQLVFACRRPLERGLGFRVQPAGRRAAAPPHPPSVAVMLRGSCLSARRAAAVKRAFPPAGPTATFTANFKPVARTARTSARNPLVQGPRSKQTGTGCISQPRVLARVVWRRCHGWAAGGAGVHRGVPVGLHLVPPLQEHLHHPGRPALQRPAVLHSGCRPGSLSGPSSMAACSEASQSIGH